MPRRPKKKDIAAQHADWLGLIETSGPFISLPVLVSEMPQGLDVIETERRRATREHYSDWLLHSEDEQVHEEWFASVIHGLLEHEQDSVTRYDSPEAFPEELTLEVPEHGETITPTFVIHESGDITAESARVLVFVTPANQPLDKKPSSSSWSASVNSRAAELCRASGVRIGLVTNGEQWVVIDAPAGETVGYATWHASLWFDEPATLDAFAGLIGCHRLFSLARDKSLEGLLDQSRKDQHEVTDQLGLQVRRAVEMLVRSLDRADQDLGGELLSDLEPKEIYEAAVTVMMRLVFLFSAEERGLLLLGDPLFDQHYAVSTLCEQLREVAEQHGEEILERRRDAWCRLLAAFRAVYAGVSHDRLRIPAYGGGLFDPDRFPFLEGRGKGTNWRDSAAETLPVDNRTVLHCLESLQYLQTKIGKMIESRRLSFRALDIEQIGHVYEGLLDHTAVRAAGTTLGLYGKSGDEPETELKQLETLVSQGRAKLVEHLTKLKVKSSKKSVEKLLDAELDRSRAERIRRTCKTDELWKRVEPFASLIRDDDFGHPIIILEGQLFATAGLDRRSTGTHYTPRSLTEPIVEYTLEPLVYQGPAEGTPRDQWNLRSPKEILDLKVCDMACGSGAFLVQACRYLGDRLVESWTEAERQAPEPNPGNLTFPIIDFDGSPAMSDRNLVPKEPDERLLTARRLIAQRCLYGVDVNPVAAEMAKLSIWLLTLSKDKPFSFLDHAIRSGDALLGLHDIRQLQRFSLHPNREIQTTFSSISITELIDQASGTRLQIERLDSDTIGHVRTQARLLDEADTRTERMRFAADMLISGYIQPASTAAERDGHISSAAAKAGQLSQTGLLEEMHEHASRALRGMRPFHWCLEFPEVIHGQGGFDAFIGNPPFLGGKRHTTILGETYMRALKVLISGQKGAADLCAYFLLQASRLLRKTGCLGFVTTNSISQGATREIGLAALMDRGFCLYRAQKDSRWPGTAGVTISPVHLYRGEWRGLYILNGLPTKQISSFLTSDAGSAEPVRLPINKGIASTGTGINGAGFIIDSESYQDWITSDTRNRDVLQPYLTAQDINQAPGSAPTRYVINFRDMDRHHAQTYSVPFDHVTKTVKPQRDKLTRQIHEQCYWKHWDRRDDVYELLRTMPRAIVTGRVSKHHIFAFGDPSWLFSDGVIVFLRSSLTWFGTLQSSVNELWVQRHKTTMRLDTNYSVSRCFLTFPLPNALRVNERHQHVEKIAHDYLECRSRLSSEQNVGLTEIYNRYHDPSHMSDGIEALRATHSGLDAAVLELYGWPDLACSLRHEFSETRVGQRLAIDAQGQEAILERLLDLNQEQALGCPKNEVSAKKSRESKRSNARRSGEPEVSTPNDSLFKGQARR